MAFPRPTLVELIERTFSDIASRLSIPTAILRRSVVVVLARAVAGASHMLHGHLDYIAREANPATAIDTLPLWAAVWGVKRKDAQFAVRTVNLVGTVNGTPLPAGTIFNRADGVQYSVNAEVLIAAGVASAAVTAVEPGELGNCAAGTVLSLVNPIAGINSAATVTADPGTDGTEVEGKDSLRARLLSRIQQPPHGGNKSDYEAWALEVPGVTRAWVYPLYLGPGTIGITFVRDDDSPSTIPSAGEVAAVQAHIDEVRPVTATPIVFAPVEVAVPLSVAVVPNTQAVKDAVTAELSDFFKRESAPGGTIYWSRMDEAISLAQGETSHQLMIPAPNTNVVRAAGEISTLGPITWL